MADWLDSILDLGGNLFDSTDNNTWLERNWDTISKVGSKAGDAWNIISANNSQQGTRNNITDLLSRLGAEEDAYNKQVYDWQVANAASRAAAARANDAARRAAANKALKVQKKMLKGMMQQYQPYADAAKTLTPKMAQNYSQYLDTTALLNQYLSPKVMQTLGEAPKAAASFNVPQPTFQKTNEQISFPDIQKILGLGG